MQILVLDGSSSPSAAARASAASAARRAPDAACRIVTTHGDLALETESCGLPVHELHRAAAILDEEGFALWLGLRIASASEEDVLLLRAGVELVSAPTALMDAAQGDGLAVLPAHPSPAQWRDVGVGAPVALCSDRMIAVARSGRQSARAVCDLLLDRPGLGVVALDVALASLPHAVLRDPAALIGPLSRLGAEHVVEGPDETLLLAGSTVIALDLSRLDPCRPWVISPDEILVLLSDQPALAAAVSRAARSRRADAPAGAGRSSARTADGIPLHPQLRELLRDEGGDAPDPFDTTEPGVFTSWLLEPLPAGHPDPVARYLGSCYTSRDDLRSAFPLVPGPDTARLVDWAERHGRDEPAYDADLLLRAAAASRDASARPAPVPAGRADPGVNLVGYLTGELGVGESARLMRAALEAAGIPHATVPVAHQLQSRQASPYRPADAPPHFDTTLLCVNADQTPAVAASVAAATRGAYRIGMWYWEVEQFPEEHRNAFEQVDEVWVATDFIRRAVEPHSPVPVTTVTPPLYRPASTAPGSVPAVVPPDRPVLLFAFDHLSSAERKNPWGAVEAFRRAFRQDEGPVLVLKSVNAARALADAERLRLLVQDEPDVVLIEEYLSAADRDALMDRCQAYVSLHRAEGLGLTLAEAMSRAKPVIATDYSGNLEFQTPENSLLVPCTMAAVPPEAGPYPVGAPWAEPDLDAAAALMRRVVEDPAWAAEIGARAASDLRERHSAQSAGAVVAARLEAIRAERRTARRTDRVARLLRGRG